MDILLMYIKIRCTHFDHNVYNSNTVFLVEFYTSMIWQINQGVSDIIFHWCYSQNKVHILILIIMYIIPTLYFFYVEFLYKHSSIKDLADQSRSSLIRYYFSLVLFSELEITILISDHKMLIICLINGETYVYMILVLTYIFSNQW